MIEEEVMGLQLGMSDYQKIVFQKRYAEVEKKTGLTFLFAFFLGLLGIDRMYLGDWGIGVVKLIFGVCTFGVFGIWWLIDILNCASRTDKKNRLSAMQVAQIVKMTVQ